MEWLKLHLHHIMLSEFKQKNNVMETSRKLCSVYGQWVICDWFAKFYSGEMSLENEPTQGCSLDINDGALKTLKESNSRHSIKELSKMVNTLQPMIAHR